MSHARTSVVSSLNLHTAIYAHRTYVRTYTEAYERDGEAVPEGAGLDVEYHPWNGYGHRSESLGQASAAEPTYADQLAGAATKERTFVPGPPV